MEEEYTFVYVEDKTYKWFHDRSIQELLMKWLVNLRQTHV